MLWFGKKKKNTAEDEAVEEINENAEVEEELDLDEGVEVVSEDEILNELNSSDEVDIVEDEENKDASPADDTADENAESGDEQPVKADVVRIIGSLDELVDYVNGKSIGSIQFLRKENNEAFDLREVYLRIARVWGSVSMAREYTPAEYAKIMLAIDVIESPDDFYVLPVITDEEREKAIIDFCEEKYGGNGKKYAKNIDKFAKMVNANGDKDEWLEHTKWIITEKITEFCEKNGISFESIEDAEADTNTEGEADE